MKATRTKKESNYLRYVFTEEELREHSRNLAQQTQLLEGAEQEKKVAVAQFAERITNHKAESSRAARNICMGYEMRTIECEVQLDTPVVGTARIVRKDTGEVVKERAMYDDEMQLELELEKSVTAAVQQ